MKIRRVGLAICLAGMFLSAPRVARGHGGETISRCHSHGDLGEGVEVDGEHCHLELPLSDQLVNAPHPLSITVERVTRVVAGVVSVQPPEVDDSELGICQREDDCRSRERCVGGYCVERSFQPLGTLYDSVQMSLKMGGPGAVLRLRW